VDDAGLKNLVRNFQRVWQFPRWRWALIAAVLSDILGFAVVLLPPLQWLLDAVTAAVLFAVLGFRWPLLTALAIEVVPVLQLFPAWTLVVMALASTESRDPVDGTGQTEQQPTSHGRSMRE
jgi:hypothetical protein